MKDEHIKHMVNRFLMWKLPDNFHPDAGISFNPEFNAEYMAARGKPPMRHTPVGTNLFDAGQAEAMVRHMIEGLGVAEHSTETPMYTSRRDSNEMRPTTEDRLTTLEEEMKNVMTDLDTLNSILSGIATDAAAIGNNFKNLEAELQAAQEASSGSVDLTNAIMIARNAQATLDGIVATAASVGATPASAPATSTVDTSASAPVDTSTGTTDPSAPTSTAVDPSAPVSTQPAVDPSAPTSTQTSSGTIDPSAPTSTQPDTSSGTVDPSAPTSTQSA